MKTIQVTAHGGPEVLKIVDLPIPEPAPHEVRLKVKAAALNHLDIWVRKGHPGLKVPLPFTPGSDLAGIVDAVGAGVTRHAPGDARVVYPATFCGQCEECLAGRENLCPEYHIFGENRPGGMAEYAIVPEACLFPKPRDMGWHEAAAFPLSWLTSWHMLIDKVSHKLDDWVLVQAAASGTGIAAVQIAQMHGLRVIATAGSEQKCAALREMGVKVVLNYRKDDLKKSVREATEGKGVRIAVDHVGEATFRQSLGALAKDGSLVTCGGSSGPKLSFDVRHLFIKHQRIIGSTMGTIPDFKGVLEGMNSGVLQPVVHKVFAPEDIAEAHREVEERRVIGKVVVAF